MCRGRGPPAAGGRCPTAPPPPAQGSHQGGDLEGTDKDQGSRKSSSRCPTSPRPCPHRASGSGWEAWASFSFIPGQGLGPCALVSEANAEKPEEACDAGDGETLKPFAYQTEAGHLRGADHGPGAAAHGRQAPLGGGPGVQWGRREGNEMPWSAGMPRDPRACPSCAPMAASVTSSSLAVVPRGSHRPPRVHVGKLRPRPVSHRPRPPRW